MSRFNLQRVSCLCSQQNRKNVMTIIVLAFKREDQQPLFEQMRWAGGMYPHSNSSRAVVWETMPASPAEPPSALYHTLTTPHTRRFVSFGEIIHTAIIQLLNKSNCDTNITRLMILRPGGIVHSRFRTLASLARVRLCMY